MHRIAVYGTLRRGCGNHSLLEDSTFLFEGIVDGVIYSLGGFPGYKSAPAGNVIVEVYEVDDATLARVDRLEGVGMGFYDRREVYAWGDDLEGNVFIYEYCGKVYEDRIIPTGDWKKRS